MQLSPKGIAFSQFFSAFLKCRLNLQYFWKKKDYPHSSCILEVTESENPG